MNLREHVLDIINFFEQIGFECEPLPEVMINDDPNPEDDVFIKTGDYDFTTNTITLYVGNRHIKDILRTFCHEMVHHHQFITDPEKARNLDASGSIYDNRELKETEREAYEKGNLLFRLYTEYKQGKVKGN